MDQMIRVRVTFAGELDNIDSILIHTELTVIAGDHESYKISAHKRSSRKLSSFHTNGAVNSSTWSDGHHSSTT